MDARSFNPTELRAAMNAVEEQEIEEDFAAKMAEPVEQPAAPALASEVAGQMIPVYRHSIEKHQLRVLEIRRECSIELRRLDDELFEAERAFVELRGRIDRQRAEIEAKAAREIEANGRIVKSSQDALVALLGGSGV